MRISSDAFEIKGCSGSQFLESDVYADGVVDFGLRTDRKINIELSKFRVFMNVTKEVDNSSEEYVNNSYDLWYANESRNVHVENGSWIIHEDSYEVIVEEYVDKTHLITYVNNVRGHFYFLNDQTVKAGRTYETEWFIVFDMGTLSNGGFGCEEKVDFVGKLSSDTVNEAYTSGRYIAYDPIFSADYSYFREDTLTYNLADYGFLSGFPYLLNGSNGVDTASLIGEGKIDSDCGNILMANETGEEQIPFAFASRFNPVYGCDTANTLIWVRSDIPQNLTVNNFNYGGSGVDDEEDRTGVYSDYNIKIGIDNGTGTVAYDLSPNGYNGTITTGGSGGGHWDTGGDSCPVGRCHIKGDIELPSGVGSFGNDVSFSIGLWANYSDEDDNAVMWGSQSTVIVKSYQSGGKIAFQLTDSGSTSSELITLNDYDDGLWHFFVYVYDAGTDEMRIYVDGINETDKSATFNGNFNTGSFCVGHIAANWLGNFCQDDSTNNWEGGYDEFFIIKRVLSPDEIQAMYNSQSSSYQTPVTQFSILGSEEGVNEPPVCTITDDANKTINENTGIDIDFNMSSSMSIEGEECFQETANVSTSCGGLSTGTYDLYNLILPLDTFDENYNTFGAPSGSIGWLLINYTKPVNHTGALWQVKDEGFFGNLTVPSSCWDNEVLEFLVVSVDIGGQEHINWSCYNTSDEWQVLRDSVGQTDIFEEAIIWEINPSNSTINCTDPDGDTLTYTLVSDNNYTVINENLSVAPDGNFSGVTFGQINVSDGTDSILIDVNTTVLPVNNPPWMDNIGNTSAPLKVKTVAIPININASQFFRDVENDQSPTNITISDNSSNSDCFMNTEQNFTIFCQSDVEENFIVTINGTDSGGLSTLQSFELSSVINFTSLLAQNFTVNDFSFASDTFVPVVNISFNTTRSAEFSVFAVFNWEKIGGSATSNINGRIIVDGNVVFQGELKSDLEKTKEFSSGINPFRFKVGSGEHNLIIEILRTGTGVIQISDMDFALVEFTSTFGNNVTHDINNISVQHSSTSFISIFKFEEEEPLKSQHFHFGKLNVDKTTGGSVDVHYQFENINGTGDVSPVSSRRIEGADNTAHILTAFIGDEIGTHTMSLLGKLDSPDTVNVNGSLISFRNKDLDENVIGSFQSTNNDSQFNDTLALSAGNNTLINHAHTLQNGTGMFLVATVSAQSSSGSQTPTYWLNGSNCFSKKERDLDLNTDISNTLMMYLCIGDGPYGLNVDVPAGETLQILDESFLGFEVTGFDIEMINVPPIPNDIISPTNESNISSDFGNITWNVFEGADDYNVGLFNTDFSLNSTVVEGFSSNSTNVSWETFSSGDYWVIVTGNNTVGSTNGTPIFITLDNTLPGIILINPTPGKVEPSTTINFDYTVDDNLLVDNCTLIIDDIGVNTDTSITKIVTQTIQTTVTQAVHTWSINCTDQVNNINNSETRIFEARLPSGSTSSGGGGGGVGGGSPTINTSLLCDKVGSFITQFNFQHTQQDLLQLQEDIQRETFFLPSFIILNSFINNFDQICAEGIVASEVLDILDIQPEVNETPNEQQLFDLQTPLVNTERTDLITGNYLFIPRTNIGLNINKYVPFGFSIKLGDISPISILEDQAAKDEKGMFSFKGFKLLSIFFKLELMNGSIMLVGLKVWVIGVLIIIGSSSFFKRRLLRKKFLEFKMMLNRVNKKS